MINHTVKCSLIGFAALAVSIGTASAQGNTSPMQQLQAVEKDSQKAKRSPSLEGAKKQSGQGIDTKTSSAPPAVQAQPGPKPSPVGLPTSDFKPKQKFGPIKEPPSPGQQPKPAQAVQQPKPVQVAQQPKPAQAVQQPKPVQAAQQPKSTSVSTSTSTFSTSNSSSTAKSSSSSNSSTDKKR